MTLTQKQTEALVAAFKKGGAHYARRGNSMGGAHRRMCVRLAEQGLVGETAPFGITIKGLIALKEVYNARYAKHGTMADILNLQEVEAALATVPHMAAHLARKAA